MRIKRIEADNIAEAMRDLRRELGEGALILHTKQLAPRGVAGWFKAPRVEILGAIDEPELVGATTPARRAPATAPLPSAPIAPAAGSFAALAQAQFATTGAAIAPMTAAAAAPAPNAKPKKGKKMKVGVAQPIAEPVDPQRQAVAERLAKFRAANPAIPIATEDARTAVGAAAPSVGIEAAASSAQLDEALHGVSFATGDFQKSGRRGRRIAFVGPTGSGKTTTLAKLAAKAQIEHGRRVGLITMDTYRIGAVPQLAAYADILGAPLEVAHSPEDLSHALARLSDRDVIFIDTIGRSPLGDGVDGLVPFLATAAADEVHLVVSATTRPQDSLRAARTFARLVPNRLVVTKVDETDDHSGIAAVARGIGLPLAWLGVGQEVPDDIEEATSGRLGALLAVSAA
jgi:flagellar biosynthesis protein FlhF